MTTIKNGIRTRRRVKKAPQDTFEDLCRELVEFIRQKHSVPPSEPLTCPILRRMEVLLSK